MTDKKINSFLERTSLIWGINQNEVINLLSLPKKKAIRINTLRHKKTDILQALDMVGIKYTPVSWCQNAYMVTNGYEHLTHHHLFKEGAYLMQNVSSFVPVIALDPKETDTILDICAATGGKTSHIAAITNNKAHIIANDSSKNRFFKMKELLNLYGANVKMTLYDGLKLKRHFEGEKINKILLDAPCSGEAAINPYDLKTFKHWSNFKVKRLAKLQKQLILRAFDLLEVGGTLVYSTCTINVQENEQVVNYLLKKRSCKIEPVLLPLKNTMPGLTIINGKQLNNDLCKTLRILPSKTQDAFFVANIIKSKQIDRL